MSERIGGSYDDALYESTFTLLYKINTETKYIESGNGTGLLLRK